MEEVNPFVAYAKATGEGKAGSPNPFAVYAQQYASNRQADYGTNLATKILAGLQVPTTLVNQATLGEPLDPNRETTGTDVIRALEKKPVLDRFTLPDVGGLIVNPTAELAKTAYLNIPAAASVVTPQFTPEQKQAIEAGAAQIPLGPASMLGTIAGKVAANPDIPAGIVSDAIRDPLNVAVPLAKVAKIDKGAQVLTSKLGEFFPENLKNALKSRFVHPVNRVEKGVKTAYENAIGEKNVSEAQILKEGKQHIEKLQTVYSKLGTDPDTYNPTIIGHLEDPRYRYDKVAKTIPDPDAAAKLNSFILNFRANRQAEKEALRKAGLEVGELKGVSYATHIMTDEAKKELGEQGAAKMGLTRTFDLNDPSLYQRLFKKPDGSYMTINEVNGLFAKGEMPGFKGVKVPKFFETDPVVLDAIAKSRTQKILAEKQFYDGLKAFAKKDGVPVQAQLMGKDLLQGMKFDPAVKELVDNAKNYVFTDELTNLYDKATNVWKSLVTFSPQFHARNALSNVISNAASGLHNPKYYAIAAKIQAGENGVLKVLPNGREITYKQLADIATKYGLDKGFLSTENAAALKDALYPSNNPIALSRRAGSVIESNAKLAHLAWKIDQGATIPEAVDSVKAALFDYGELTAFERQYMKRVMPFYAWVRKNLPRQLEIAATKPQVNSKQAIIKANLEANEPLTDREQAAKPDYFDELLSIHLGKTQTGRDLFASVGTPLVDLGRFKADPNKTITDNLIDSAGQFLGDVNPFTKMGMELVFNRPTMDPTRELTVDKEKQLVPVPEWVGLLPNKVQDLMGVQETKKTGKLAMPKIWGVFVNNLASVPQLRFAGKVASDRMTDEEKAYAVMSFLGGIKFVPEDLKRDAVREHRQLIEERRNKRSDAKKFKDVE